MILAVLVVLSAAVGATGAVAAQDTGENDSTDTATDDGFYSPPEDSPLNVRFRDASANTVESVVEGVLNLNIVYGLFEEPFDVEITAPGLNNDQVDDIAFDDPENDPNDLDRTSIVGMNFTGVPAGDYQFTVSVVGADAESTVGLEVLSEGTTPEEPTPGANDTPEEPTETDEPPTSNETELGNETAGNETELGNETAGNETELGNETAGNETATDVAESGNASITATPATAGNESAMHNVSVVASPNATGNLTEVTVDYRQSNASIGLVGGNIAGATLGGESVINNTTAPTIGPEGRNLTVGFDGTVEVTEGDRLAMNYSGVTNPPEAGTYTVAIALNNGSFQPATLDITEAAAGNATATPAPNGTAAATDNATAANDTSGDNGTATTAEGTDAGGPGFGIVVAVVALLGAALLARRRG